MVIMSGQSRESLESLLEENALGQDAVKIVHRFLLRHDFDDTAESLAQEADKKGFKFLEDKIEMNMGTRNNISIMPNDREIPLFIKDDVSEKEQDLHCFEKHTLKTNRCTQTENCSLSFKSSDDSKHLLPIARTNKKTDRYNYDLAPVDSNLYNMWSNHEKLKLRFHKLHADYHKLIGVAGELTAALENSVKGRNVDLQAMLESCIKIFPDLFGQNIRDSVQTSSILPSEPTNVETIYQHDFNVSSISPKLLDFKKIKAHLIEGNPKSKVFLLQALRWKITLGRSGEQDEVIHEYISSDLFGLHGRLASDNGKSVLPYLMISNNTQWSRTLQQCTARLLNALASFRCGRDYLSVGTSLVDVVVEYLKNIEEIDGHTRDMLLATLQKLSLRKQQRLHMIKIGLVEWLICHLHDASHRICPYGLEYATALLMNLSLHREARTNASSIAPLAIATLINLLSIDPNPAIPYINGALSNFLSNRVINEEAKKLRLSSILEYYRQRKSGEIRNHYDHILKVHKREYTDNTEDEETADEDNEEFDVLENEIEEDDPVRIQVGDLYGEALLAAHYSVSPDIPSSVCRQRSAIVDVNNSKIKTAASTRQSCLYFNDTYRSAMREKTLSRESRETIVSSSITLASACESGARDPGKFSSMASL